MKINVVEPSRTMNIVLDKTDFVNLEIEGLVTADKETRKDLYDKFGVDVQFVNVILSRKEKG